MLRLAVFVLFNALIVLVLVRPHSPWTWALVLSALHLVLQAALLILT
jgi:hypothetical protein